MEKLEADPAAWHTIEIDHQGTHIVVTFDGKKMIEHDDATFAEAGQAGLWVKADGRSSFAPLKVTTPGRPNSKSPKNAKKGKEQKS